MQSKRVYIMDHRQSTKLIYVLKMNINTLREIPTFSINRQSLKCYNEYEYMCISFKKSTWEH